MQLAAGASYQQEYLGASFEGGTVGECTSTAPVHCSRWIAICCARKVCEWSEFTDLRRAEGGDCLTLDADRCGRDKPDKGENKDGPYQNHNCWKAKRKHIFKASGCIAYIPRSHVHRRSSVEGRKGATTFNCQSQLAPDLTCPLLAHCLIFWP